MAEYIIDGREYMEGFVGDPVRTISELVRCKDCKFSGCYTTEENGNIYRISCNKRNDKLNEWHKPDWFCADGERKEGR